MYLDQSVVFTEMPKGSGRWSPLGLEDLLALTGNKPAARAGAAGASRGSGGAQQSNGAGAGAGAGSHAFGGLD